MNHVTTSTVPTLFLALLWVAATTTQPFCPIPVVPPKCLSFDATRAPKPTVVLYSRAADDAAADDNDDDAMKDDDDTKMWQEIQQMSRRFGQEESANNNNPATAPWDANDAMDDNDDDDKKELEEIMRNRFVKKGDNDREMWEEAMLHQQYIEEKKKNPDLSIQFFVRGFIGTSISTVF